MKVNIVNESKKTKGKPVAGKKKKRKKSSSFTAVAKRPRRNNPAKKKKRRSKRRDNPNKLFSGVVSMFSGVGGMIAGEMFAGWVSQRMGAGQLPFPGATPLPASPYGGTQWSLWSYLAIAVGGQFAANLVGRMAGPEAKKNFKRGVALSVARKLLWTEGFARQPWLQQAFGNTLVRTNDGNTYYQAGAGQPYNAMMGFGATILEARPLDGSSIQPKTALDGAQIVRAGPLDTGRGAGGRRYARRARSSAMAGFYPKTGEDMTDAQRHALWLDAGSSDLYQAAY